METEVTIAWLYEMRKQWIDGNRSHVLDALAEFEPGWPRAYACARLCTSLGCTDQDALLRRLHSLSETGCATF